MTDPISSLPSSIIIKSVTEKPKEPEPTQLGPTIEAAREAESRDLVSGLPSGQIIESVTRKRRRSSSSGSRSTTTQVGPTIEAAMAAAPEPTPSPTRTRVVSNIPSQISSLPSGVLVQGAVEGTLQKPKESEKPGFFTLEDQARRLKNVGSTFASLIPGDPFEQGTIRVNRQIIGLEPAAKTLEFAANRPFQTALAATGIVGAVRGVGAAAAPTVAKAGAALRATKGVQAVTKAKGAIEATRAGRFGFDLLGTGARALAITEGTKKASEILASPEQKEIIKQPFFSDVIGAGLAAEAEAQPSLLRGLAFQISPAFSGKKSIFEETVRSEFEARGVEDLDTAVAAAKRQRTALSIGEAAGLLEISRSAEAIGRKGVSKAFTKAAGKQIPAQRSFGELFKLTAPSIARAGVIEGAVGEFTQEVSREEAISPKKIAAFGAFGGVSAGLIGGTIGGLRAAKPGASKVIEVATSIADPFEKPGDILQDIFEAGSRRLGRAVPPTPVISITPTEVFSIGTPTQTQTPAKGKAKGKAPAVSVPSFVPSVVPSFVPTPAVTPVPTVVPAPDIRVPTTLDDIITPKPVPTPTPTPTPVPTPADILNLNVNVPTTVPVVAPVPIPTATPLLRVPPPIPLKFPAGTGGFGSRVGLQTKFLNELEAGLSVLGFGTPKAAKRGRR